jgi:hypothetical protein
MSWSAAKIGATLSVVSPVRRSRDGGQSVQYQLLRPGQIEIVAAVHPGSPERVAPQIPKARRSRHSPRTWFTGRGLRR